MRVVLLVLDSMPHRMVNAADTPNLWREASLGGRAPDGGRSLPVSVTYSNHAAFVTGVDAPETGLWGNRAWVDGKFIKTAHAGPRATTIFDRCRDAGRRSVAAVGDHMIVTTIGAQSADDVWPPTAEVPPGTAVDAYGYPADSAVIAAAASMDLAADLVVLHLNEPDTTLHVYGPDSAEALAQVRRSDAAYGELLQLLQPGWDDTVVFSISDHDQEQITDDVCVDLKAAVAEKGWDAQVSHEGTGAVIIGAASAESVSSLPGVEGAIQASAEAVIAWTAPGAMFGSGAVPTLGNHGSPRCRTQMAIVSGGHPKVAALATEIERRQPTSLTWAPLIQRLLGI